MDSRRRHALAFALLAGLVLAAYANSFQAGFVLDNKVLILEDPRLRVADLGPILHENYWGAFWEGGIYRPVTTLSYLLNYTILGNGDRPFGYHLINYLLHAANACLVYLLALTLLDSFWMAFFTAALWALHPVCTESVTNIVGRADELAALAVLGALLLYIRSTGLKGLLGMMAITTVGVFSKENAVVVLGLAILYDFTYRVRPRVERYAALGLPVLAMFYVRSMVFAKANVAVFPFLENPLTGADFLTARLTAIKVAGKYLWLLAWPRSLSCDYSFNQIPLANWGDWRALAALVAVGGLFLLAAVCYRRHKVVFFFIGFSVLNMLPMANLFVLIGTIMAERFLYLPAVGFAGCIVVAVYATGGRRVAPAVLCILAVVLGIRTFLRNPDWKDEETLWSRALEVCPASYKTHLNLAHAWSEKGKIDQSIAEGEKALAIVAPLPDSLNSAPPFQELGAYYGLKGDAAPREERAGWYQKALQVLLRGVAIDREFNAACWRRELARGKKPDQIGLFGSEELYGNLGQAYLRLGNSQQALQAFLYQRRLVPRKSGVYRSLAAAYLAAGKNEEGATSLLEFLAIDRSHGIMPEVLDLYGKIDPSGCAVVVKGSRRLLDLNCPLVHRHLCAAYLDLGKVYSEAGLEKLAQQASVVARQYSCYQ